jgi:EAL domain-containing protein (putative c-di-GMP-specific phosphodiesterase class I)
VAQLRVWQERGLALSVAVNLSVRQFNDQLVGEVGSILKATDVDPRNLELEVTESIFLGGLEESERIVRALTDMGLRFTIDDFGTGYSSLARLKKLPIDALKIDRSFVGDIAVDPDDAAITSAIIAMAHSLRLRVVAEGVETHEQARFLRERGCDEMQGFLFGRPVPPQDIASLARQPARPPLALVSGAR